MNRHDYHASLIANLSTADMLRFNAFLAGWLLTAVDEDAAREALDAAAASVNS